jgi:hypothetical protein
MGEIAKAKALFASASGEADQSIAAVKQAIQAVDNALALMERAAGGGRHQQFRTARRTFGLSRRRLEVVRRMLHEAQEDADEYAAIL